MNNKEFYDSILWLPDNGILAYIAQAMLSVVKRHSLIAKCNSI